MTAPRLPSRVSLVCTIVVAAVGSVAACSATDGRSTFTTSNPSGAGGGQSSGNATGGASSGPGGGGDTTGTITLTGQTGGGSAGVGGACAASPYMAQQLPLDMYIMQDQSGSMSDTVAGGGTKWDAVKGAFTAFVNQPGTAGISVGLQYFGVTPGGATCGTTCVTDADCGPASCGPCFFGICLGGGGTDSCTSSDYAKPEVEIEALPGVASKIVSSLGQHGPSTSTPTGPALQGAVDHAKAWAMGHPNHVVIAVLATDGQPNECSPTSQAGLAAIAAAALAGTPSVKTFAIGTFAPADIPSGPNLLDAVAAAGGTTKAFNINTQQNVNQAFLDALNMIRGSALGCQYTIPKPTMGTPDFGKVNVQYTPGGGGNPVDILNVKDAAHCPASGDGWYYDNNSAPTQIELCPATCTKVGADSNGKIEILLGCQTQTAT